MVELQRFRSKGHVLPHPRGSEKCTIKEGEPKALLSPTPDTTALTLPLMVSLRARVCSMANHMVIRTKPGEPPGATAEEVSVITLGLTHPTLV